MSSEPRNETVGDDAVRWSRVPAARTAEPIRLRRPYVELKLEHPDLPATRFGGGFFPAAVPYRLDGDRVFYWQSKLGGSNAGASSAGASNAGEANAGASSAPGRADAFCATTDELLTLRGTGGAVPSLTRETDAGHEVVVDGTVAGDTTTAAVANYAPPRVELVECSRDRAELSVGPLGFSVDRGTRREIPLPTQSVRLLEPPADDDAGRPDDPRRVSPRLVVRYPGRRTLFHPAPGASYLLFPSFGIDLDAVPNPVPVDASTGLDPDAVADAAGAPLDDRPFAERVLWQAFVHAAFDPGRDRKPALTQFPDGLLAVRDASPDDR
ncbi:MAG: hypothetical protein ABEJ28_10750 [Salinigranum sp.]